MTTIVRNLSLYLILVLTTVLVVTILQTLYTVCEGKKEVNIELNLVHSPMLIAYWVIISLFVNNEQINTIPDIILYSGMSSLPGIIIQCNALGFGPADYLVLSGALGKPCTRVIYS